MNTDAVVVGAGHNGLVAALHLARAGRRVVVCEQRENAGGLCGRREFHPGYTVPGLLHDTSLLRPTLVGIDVPLRDSEPPVLAPSPKGAGLLLHRDPELAAAELSEKDTVAYRKWRDFLSRIRRFIASVLDQPPPPMDVSSLSSLWSLGWRGLSLRRLGRRDMVEVMRIAPMSLADWLTEHFESQELCELLASPAVLGSFMGPRSAGSAIQLLFRECAAAASVVGGPAALIDHLLAECSKHSVDVRTGSRVERIRVQAGEITGVTLENGEEITTPTVASSCDPKQTLLGLLPPGQLPLAVEHAVSVVRTRGTTAKVHLALNGPLAFAGRENIEVARVGGGHLAYLERAFDAVKYRGFSEQPNLDVYVPTVEQPSLAPDGHHVASILVSFVPYDLQGGWTAERREELGDLVVQRLAEVSSGLHDKIVAREVLSPADLETEYGLTGGHIHHGEHALDQLLFMRPTPACAHYKTPVRGLFLCGSGSHPGGGVTGVPGALAAAAILGRR